MADTTPTNSTQAGDWAEAEAFYEKELLPKLSDTAKGKVLVLDLASGDYAVGADLNEADSRLRERHPDVFAHAFRIGYRTVGSIGGGSIEESSK